MYKLICSNLSKSHKSLTSFTSPYKIVAQSYETHRWKRFVSETDLYRKQDAEDAEKGEQSCETAENEITTEAKTQSSSSFFNRKHRFFSTESVSRTSSFACCKKHIFSTESIPENVRCSATSPRYFHSSLMAHNSFTTASPKKKAFKDKQAAELYKTAFAQCMRIRSKFDKINRRFSWVPRQPKPEYWNDAPEPEVELREEPPSPKLVTPRKIIYTPTQTRSGNAYSVPEINEISRMRDRANYQFKSRNFKITYPTHSVKYKLAFSKPHDIKQVKSGDPKKQKEGLKMQPYAQTFISKYSQARDQPNLALIVKRNTENRRQFEEQRQLEELEEAPEEYQLIKQHPTVTKASATAKMAISSKYNKLLSKSQLQYQERQSEIDEKLTEEEPPAAATEEPQPNNEELYQLKESPSTTINMKELEEDLESVLKNLEAHANPHIVAHPISQINPDLATKHPKDIMWEKDATFDIETTCIKTNENSTTHTKYGDYVAEVDQMGNIIETKDAEDLQPNVEDKIPEKTIELAKEKKKVEIENEDNSEERPQTPVESLGEYLKKLRALKDQTAVDRSQLRKTEELKKPVLVQKVETPKIKEIPKRIEDQVAKVLARDQKEVKKVVEAPKKVEHVVQQQIKASKPPSVMAVAKKLTVEAEKVPEPPKKIEPRKETFKLDPLVVKPKWPEPPKTKELPSINIEPVKNLQMKRHKSEEPRRINYPKMKKEANLGGKNYADIYKNRPPTPDTPVSSRIRAKSEQPSGKIVPSPQSKVVKNKRSLLENFVAREPPDDKKCDWKREDYTKHYRRTEQKKSIENLRKIMDHYQMKAQEMVKVQRRTDPDVINEIVKQTAELKRVNKRKRRQEQGKLSPKPAAEVEKPKPKVEEKKDLPEEEELSGRTKPEKVRNRYRLDMNLRLEPSIEDTLQLMSLPENRPRLRQIQLSPNQDIAKTPKIEDKPLGVNNKYRLDQVEIKPSIDDKPEYKELRSDRYRLDQAQLPTTTEEKPTLDQSTDPEVKDKDPDVIVSRLDQHIAEIKASTELQVKLDESKTDDIQVAEEKEDKPESQLEQILNEETEKRTDKLEEKPDKKAKSSESREEQPQLEAKAEPTNEEVKLENVDKKPEANLAKLQPVHTQSYIEKVRAQQKAVDEREAAAESPETKLGQILTEEKDTRVKLKKQLDQKVKSLDLKQKQVKAEPTSEKVRKMEKLESADKKPEPILQKLRPIRTQSYIENIKKQQNYAKMKAAGLKITEPMKDKSYELEDDKPKNFGLEDRPMIRRDKPEPPPKGKVKKDKPKTKNDMILPSKGKNDPKTMLDQPSVEAPTQDVVKEISNQLIDKCGVTKVEEKRGKSLAKLAEEQRDLILKQIDEKWEEANLSTEKPKGDKEDKLEEENGTLGLLDLGMNKRKYAKEYGTPKSENLKEAAAKEVEKTPDNLTMKLQPKVKIFKGGIYQPKASIIDDLTTNIADKVKMTKVEENQTKPDNLTTNLQLKTQTLEGIEMKPRENISLLDDVATFELPKLERDAKLEKTGILEKFEELEIYEEPYSTDSCFSKSRRVKIEDDTGYKMHAKQPEEKLEPVSASTDQPTPAALDKDSVVQQEIKMNPYSTDSCFATREKIKIDEDMQAEPSKGKESTLITEKAKESPKKPAKKHIIKREQTLGVAKTFPETPAETPKAEATTKPSVKPQQEEEIFLPNFKKKHVKKTSKRKDSNVKSPPAVKSTKPNVGKKIEDAKNNVENFIKKPEQRQRLEEPSAEKTVLKDAKQEECGSKASKREEENCVEVPGKTTKVILRLSRDPLMFMSAYKHTGKRSSELPKLDVVEQKARKTKYVKKATFSLSRFSLFDEILKDSAKRNEESTKKGKLFSLHMERERKYERQRELTNLITPQKTNFEASTAYFSKQERKEKLYGAVKTQKNKKTSSDHALPIDISDLTKPVPKQKAYEDDVAPKRIAPRRSRTRICQKNVYLSKHDRKGNIYSTRGQKYNTDVPKSIKLLSKTSSPELQASKRQEEKSPRVKKVFPTKKISENAPEPLHIRRNPILDWEKWESRYRPGPKSLDSAIIEPKNALVTQPETNKLENAGATKEIEHVPTQPQMQKTQTEKVADTQKIQEASLEPLQILKNPILYWEKAESKHIQESKSVQDKIMEPKVAFTTENQQLQLPEEVTSATEKEPQVTKIHPEKVTVAKKMPETSLEPLQIAKNPILYWEKADFKHIQEAKAEQGKIMEPKMTFTTENHVTVASATKKQSQMVKTHPEKISTIKKVFATKKIHKTLPQIKLKNIEKTCKNPTPSENPLEPIRSSSEMIIKTSKIISDNSSSVQSKKTVYIPKKQDSVELLEQRDGLKPKPSVIETKQDTVKTTKKIDAPKPKPESTVVPSVDKQMDWSKTQCHLSEHNERMLTLMELKMTNEIGKMLAQEKAIREAQIPKTTEEKEYVLAQGEQVVQKTEVIEKQGAQAKETLAQKEVIEEKTVVKTEEKDLPKQKMLVPEITALEGQTVNAIEEKSTSEGILTVKEKSGKYLLVQEKPTLEEQIVKTKKEKQIQRRNMLVQEKPTLPEEQTANKTKIKERHKKLYLLVQQKPTLEEQTVKKIKEKPRPIQNLLVQEKPNLEEQTATNIEERKRTRKNLLVQDKFLLEEQTANNIEVKERPRKYLLVQDTPTLEEQTANKIEVKERPRKYLLVPEKPTLEEQTAIKIQEIQRPRQNLLVQEKPKLTEQTTNKIQETLNEKLAIEENDTIEEHTVNKIDEKPRDKLLVHYKPILGEQTAKKIEEISTKELLVEEKDTVEGQIVDKIDEKPRDKLLVHYKPTLGEQTVEKIEETSTEKLLVEEKDSVEEQTVNDIKEIPREKLLVHYKSALEEQTLNEIEETSTKNLLAEEKDTIKEPIVNKIDETARDKLLVHYKPALEEQIVNKIEATSTKNLLVEEKDTIKEQTVNKIDETSRDKLLVHYKPALGEQTMNEIEETSTKNLTVEEKDTIKEQIVNKIDEMLRDKLRVPYKPGLEEQTVEKIEETSTEKPLVEEKDTVEEQIVNNIPETSIEKLLIQYKAVPEEQTVNKIEDTQKEQLQAQVQVGKQEETTDQTAEKVAQLLLLQEQTVKTLEEKETSALEIEEKDTPKPTFLLECSKEKENSKEHSRIKKKLEKVRKNYREKCLEDPQSESFYLAKKQQATSDVGAKLLNENDPFYKLMDKGSTEQFLLECAAVKERKVIDKKIDKLRKSYLEKCLEDPRSDAFLLSKKEQASKDVENVKTKALEEAKKKPPPKLLQAPKQRPKTALAITRSTYESEKPIKPRSRSSKTPEKRTKLAQSDKNADTKLFSKKHLTDKTFNLPDNNPKRLISSKHVDEDKTYAEKEGKSTFYHKKYLEKQKYLKDKQIPNNSEQCKAASECNPDAQATPQKYLFDDQLYPTFITFLSQKNKTERDSTKKPLRKVEKMSKHNVQISPNQNSEVQNKCSDASLDDVSTKTASNTTLYEFKAAISEVLVKDEPKITATSSLNYMSQYKHIPSHFQDLYNADQPAIVAKIEKILKNNYKPEEKICKFNKNLIKHFKPQSEITMHKPCKTQVVVLKDNKKEHTNMQKTTQLAKEQKPGVKNITYVIEKTVPDRYKQIKPKPLKPVMHSCDRICLPTKSISQVALKPSIDELTTLNKVMTGEKITGAPIVAPDNLDKYKHLKITHMRVRRNRKRQENFLPSILIVKAKDGEGGSTRPDRPPNLKEIMDLRYELLKKLHREFCELQEKEMEKAKGNLQIATKHETKNDKKGIKECIKPPPTDKEPTARPIVFYKTITHEDKIEVGQEKEVCNTNVGLHTHNDSNFAEIIKKLRQKDTDGKKGAKNENALSEDKDKPDDSEK